MTIKINTRLFLYSFVQSRVGEPSRKRIGRGRAGPLKVCGLSPQPKVQVVHAVIVVHMHEPAVVVMFWWWWGGGSRPPSRAVGGPTSQSTRTLIVYTCPCSCYALLDLPASVSRTPLTTHWLFFSRLWWREKRENPIDRILVSRLRSAHSLMGFVWRFI